MQTNYLQRLLRMVVFVFALTPVFVWGHSPNVSGTYLTETDKENGSWVLQVRASATAFEHEIAKQFADKPYKTLDDFKKLALQVVIDNMTVSFDDASAKLNDPNIRVGHETVVAFKITAPLDAKRVLVKNTSFINIFKSRSLMTLAPKNAKKEQVTLDKSNEFMAVFQLEDD